jgi:hypothetical protein
MDLSVRRGFESGKKKEGKRGDKKKTIGKLDQEPKLEMKCSGGGGGASS